MVKIISNVKGDMVSASVELAGDLQVIVSEIGSAISSMYNRIKKCVPFPAYRADLQ